jgi:hypothetical protein
MGGINQQKRMNIDKLRSLKKALLYSYQAATAVLADGREFRCLINPNKLSVDLDNKILSIPFEDYPVNGIPVDEPNIDDSDLGFETGFDKEGMWSDMVPVDCLPDSVPSKVLSNYEMQPVGLREGDVIEWKENGSHWLIYLQRLEETAYFRADLRRCRYQIELENGSRYWVYVKGPSEKNINWKQSSGIYFNKLNYTLQLYITQNKETLEYFHRFNKIFLHGRPWEIQAIDDISTPGLIEVHLKETYNNLPETDLEAAVEASVNVVEVDERDEMYIHGVEEVYPYEIYEYELKNYVGAAGTWKIKNTSRQNMVKFISTDKLKASVSILTGKSGSFELIYETPQGAVVAATKIKVLSI